MGSAQEYEGKTLKNVAAGELDLPEDEAERARLEELRASSAWPSYFMRGALKKDVSAKRSKSSFS